MTQGVVITEAYRKMQQELHQNPNYGVASIEYAPLVAQVMESTGIDEILDYGAGKGRLGQRLREMYENPLIVHEYDPAIPAWSHTPAPCRLVACIDVLEHIEPELLDAVLDDLARVTLRVGVFTVHTGPAAKVLPDGRNAHLIQKPPAWWLPKFLERFELTTFNRLSKVGFYVVVERTAA